MFPMNIVPAGFEDFQWWPEGKDLPLYRGLSSCTIKKYERFTFNFNKVAIISKNATIRNQVKYYFETFVLPLNGMDTRDGEGDWVVEGHETSDDVFDTVASEDDQPYCFAVQINNIEISKENKTYDFDFEFQFNRGLVPDTSQPPYDINVMSPDFDSYDKWMMGGSLDIFYYLNQYVAMQIIGKNMTLKNPNPLYLQTLGYTPMESRPFIDMTPQSSLQLSRNFPYFLMVISLIPLYYLTTKVASEKESKAREGMQMMGLSNNTYYGAMFIFYSFICLMTSLIVAFISIKYIFRKVEFLVFFTLCFLYQLSLFGLAFVIVAILPTKRSSSVASTLFHLISFYISFTLYDRSTPGSIQYGLSVLPNVAMNQCIKQIFWFNLSTSNGARWNTISIVHENYSLLFGMLFLLFDIIFYSLLGMYLDQVVPSQYGVAKPWNFCCLRKQKRSVEEDDEQEDLIKHNEYYFEEVDDKLKRQEKTGKCLSITGLRKEFGKKIAVHNTNMNMYNGQIFALLGHNGAGKTTTISMLTGLFQPTKGKATIDGIDIFSDMEELRKILGVCPQHDVLFDFLTPEDHLRLFASFKGVKDSEIEEQVQRILVEIDLVQQKKQLAKTLSGGQKRKLSVAIALIGDSKLVILDEPTSGMDTTSRRKLWDMLKKNKKERIVILTTHFMDEADILGDRIGIMAEGQLACLGSSLFLKNRFGIGYNLLIAKNTLEKSPRIDTFITDKIPNAIKIQEVSNEITYQLPQESQDLFKDFFFDLDNSLNQLGISSYGIGMTTLEEVFLKIGHGIDDHIPTMNRSVRDSIIKEKYLMKPSKNETQGTSLNQSSITISQEEDILESYSISSESEKNVFFSHLCVLLKKKTLMQIRDRKALCIDLFFPLLLIFIGLFLATTQFYSQSIALKMTPTVYPQPIGMYWNLESPRTERQDVHSFYKDNIYDKHWIAYDNETIIEDDGEITAHGNVGFTQSLKEYDKNLFNKNKEEGRTSFGQMYLNYAGTTRFFNPVNKKYLSIKDYQAAILVNATSCMAPGMWGAFASEVFMRDYLKNYQNKKYAEAEKNLNITISSRPFPLSKQFQSINSAYSGTSAALLMSIAWMMLSDSLIQNIIRERQRNIKHQIMISGSSLSAYWIANYISDVIFQIPHASLAISGVWMFDIDAPQVMYLFFGIVLVNPLFIYVFSFFFDKEDSASMAIKLVYFLYGIIFPITTAIFQVLSVQTFQIAQYMRFILIPVPIYSLAQGYISITNRVSIQLMKFKLHKFQEYEVQPYDYSLAGPNLECLFFSIPVLIFLLICIENRCFCCSRKKKIVQSMPKRNNYDSNTYKSYNIDEGIGIEEDRVNRLDKDQLPVRVSNIKKTYGKVTAVEKVSFGLEYGECFALLGVSGAGKTNCFKCLTGEIKPTQGEVTVNGFDVTTNSGFKEARKQIGYCPQFDAIFEGLTVKEHLEIYATLKGIKKSLRTLLVEKTITDMDLDNFVNVPVNNLSGGNKRKVSVAIAIIGNPPIVLLDEPSTGVDPQAKRFMWDVISKISILRKKSAVIITTHAMEEAEALCTKMGIMVKGKFKCFGSAQTIKDKYGTGYEIEIKIRQVVDQDITAILERAQLSALNSSSMIDLEACIFILKQLGNDALAEELSDDGIGMDFYQVLKQGQKVEVGEFLRWMFVETQGNNAIDYLETKFKALGVLEHYGNSWIIKVSRDDYQIGFIFGLLQDMKSQFNISEYSASFTTLEQIFNNFAKESDRKERSVTFRRNMSASVSATKHQLTKMNMKRAVTDI